MASNLIDLGKTPASCSAICQSSDVSDFFKATKKALKYITAKRYKNDILFDRIMMVLEARFTNDKRKQFADSLCQIVYAIRETLTDEIIKKGYERCGQYPLDLTKAMSLCTVKISPKERKNMENKLGEMKQIFITKGTITEADMDNAKIVNVNDTLYKGMDKDQRALHHQRAVLMNAPEAIARYKDYRERTEPQRTKAADTRAFNESIKGLSKDEQDAAKAARKIQLKELRDQKKAANNNN